MAEHDKRAGQNLVIIMSDEHNRDWSACYGHTLARTPHISDYARYDFQIRDRAVQYLQARARALRAYLGIATQQLINVGHGDRIMMLKLARPVKRELAILRRSHDVLPQTGMDLISALHAALKARVMATRSP